MSCIIPSHNEATRISRVLSVVTSHPLIKEVIVVDDGSKDNTPEIVKKFPSVRLFVSEVNKGKSYSVARGIKESVSDYILMIDADLNGLGPEDIDYLIKPVKEGRADVSMGVRTNTPLWMRLLRVDLMNGERLFPKSMVMPTIDQMMSLKSYALEVFLNRLVINNKYKINSVFFKNVRDDLKASKTGFFAGWKLFFSMWRDILKTVSFWEWLYQNFALSRLVVR